MSHRRLPSGAGRDAHNMAHVAPMAMIFMRARTKSATRRRNASRWPKSRTASTPCCVR